MLLFPYENTQNESNFFYPLFCSFFILCDLLEIAINFPASILRKSISGRHRPVRVADGPMTADVDLRRMLAGNLEVI